MAKGAALKGIEEELCFFGPWNLAKNMITTKILGAWYSFQLSLANKLSV